jgi:hypothetical protein
MDLIVNDKGEPITNTMLAYIAGFFDGEGCITAYLRSNSGRRCTINCIITQKTRGVLDLIKSYFGGYICEERGGSSNKDNNKIYKLHFSPLASIGLLKAISPYLIVKKQEAQIAVEYHELRMNNKLRGEDYYYLSDSSKKHELNTVKILHKLKEQQRPQALLIPAQNESETMAYVAGIFDAEGCVSIFKREKQQGKYKSIDHHVICTVTQELQLLVKYMQSLFSGIVYISCRRKSNDGKIIRNVYRWSVSHKKALKFLEKVENYLIIKKPQAELGIQLQRSHSTKRSKDAWLTPEIINQRDSQKELMHQLKRDINAGAGTYIPRSREEYRNSFYK